MINTINSKTIYGLLNEKESIEFFEFKSSSRIIFSDKKIISKMINRLNRTCSQTLLIIHPSEYKLPQTLISSLVEHYKANGSFYSHVDGKYVGLDKILIEIVSLKCLENLLDYERAILPNNQLNAYIFEESSVYWMNFEELRFYLVECFDQYYSKPKSISIDTTPFCNLSCKKCHFYSSDSPYNYTLRDRKNMPLDVWKKLIDKISDEIPLVPITPSMGGEPLMNPHLSEMVNYATKKGHPCSFFTNGNLLTEENIKNLIDAGLAGMTVSLDSNNAEKYEQFQKGGDYNNVLKNIDTFLKIRGRSHFPFIGVHFLESPENSEDFDSYFKHWIDKVDYISKGIFLDITKKHKPWKYYVKPAYRGPCTVNWNSMFILTDGDVVPCNNYLSKGSSMGNAFKNSLLDIWKSDAYENFRSNQIGKKRNLEYCGAASCWGSSYEISKIKDDVLHSLNTQGGLLKKSIISNRVRLERYAYNTLQKMNVSGETLYYLSKGYMRLNKLINYISK